MEPSKATSRVLGDHQKLPERGERANIIDFALQPKVQAALTRYISYGPTNQAALKLIRPEDLSKLPSAPDHFKAGFDLNGEWWAENLSSIGQQWQAWVLRRG